MKIGIVLNARYPTEKAYGIQVDAMAKGFVENGDRLAIFYPRRTKVLPTPVEGIEYIPCGPYLPLVLPFLFSLYRFVLLPIFARNIRAWKPDALLVNDPVQAVFLGKRERVYWDLHDVPAMRTAFRQWSMRTLLKRVQGIVSTNILKLTALQKITPSLPPHVVLPNPVTFPLDELQAISKQTAREKLSLPQEAFLVMYVGQLFPWKGVDTVIEALGEVDPSDVTFHIVGGLGIDLERTRTLLAQHPSDAIKLHGQRPREEVKYWLRAADLLVIPNSGKSSLSREDTNPMKVYEAIAAERVILASDLPSIREALGDYPKAAFVAPDDPESWRTAVREEREMHTLEQQGASLQSGAYVLTPRDRAHAIVAFIQQTRASI
jgi:glycosyltransferase involved in cell wall biosynthesis